MTDWLDAMMIDIHEMESKVPYWLDEANTVVRVAQEFFVRVGARIAMFHIDRHYDAIPSAGYVASGMLRAITWMHPDSENQYDCDVQKNCFCLVVENFCSK